jgi:hypothetical protein
MSHSRELATAMAIVRQNCYEVAFVAGTTDIGLDNDLLQLHSRKVVLEGYYYSQINNPNKGLGVIHHGTVCNCTSWYCGGHVASRRESTLNCVTILFTLPGASFESQNNLCKTEFFWDRGYGGIEGEVNSQNKNKQKTLNQLYRKFRNISSPYSIWRDCMLVQIKACFGHRRKMSHCVSFLVRHA